MSDQSDPQLGPEQGDVLVEERVDSSTFRRNTRAVDDASSHEGWTAQQGPDPETTADVGYQVQPHQLPDPAIAREAGVPLQPISPTIVVGGEEALGAYYGEGDTLPGGPERVHRWTGESHDPDLFAE